MAKKYVPSGYQIINLNVEDKSSGVAFTPETDDEKLLLKILESRECKKPILLHIKTSSYDLTGIAVFDTSTISLLSGNIGTLVSEFISETSGKLQWTETEE